MKQGKGTVMRKLILACSMALASFMALAQTSPVGKWKTIDDETGEVKSIVAIEDAGGVVKGHVEQVLKKGADPKAVCDKCDDDRKGQPMQGLEIIRGAKKAASEDYWEGSILDPEKGKTYKLRMTPVEGGAKLQIRGYLGPFYRTQVWVRTN
jgi:uncharacterized protein (DUF2147 family)